MLTEVLGERRGSMNARVLSGIATQEQANLLATIMDNVKIWVVVLSADDKNAAHAEFQRHLGTFEVDVFSLEDVQQKLEKPLE